MHTLRLGQHFCCNNYSCAALTFSHSDFGFQFTPTLLIEYSFHAEQDAPATHKISLGYKSDIRSGHHRPDTQPETFADVRLLLADWIAENLPQRLNELREIAAKINDADMELSRSIRTGGTIKLKPATANS